jgi:flagellar hook-length control protein FliK
VFALMALPGGAAASHPAAAGTEASAAGAHAPDADAAASRSRGATAVAAEPRSPLTRTEAEAASAAPQARPGSAAAQASALARQEADGTPEASRARADETPQTPTLLQVWDTAAQRTSQHAVHAPAAAELRAPVGTEAWDAQLGRSLTWMAGERHQIAEVRLNPPELGPLQIVLHLGGDDGNQASVSFSSPHADVRAALETALPRLREMLAESGISLGQANVNAEAFRDGGGERQPASGGNAVPGAAVSGSHALPAAVRGGTGLVDIFA